MFDERQHGRVLRAHAIECPRAEVSEGPSDLDLDDGVLELAQAHSAVLDGHERTPQTLGTGLALQFADDVEEGLGPDQRLGGQHGLIDEGGDPRAQVQGLRGKREIDHVS
jgi:hypothetical protein